MAEHQPTIRSLATPIPGDDNCIVCGGDGPTVGVIIMPDPPPAAQFTDYSASAHLHCFTALPIIRTQELL